MTRPITLFQDVLVELVATRSGYLTVIEYRESPQPVLRKSLAGSVPGTLRLWCS